MLWQWKGTLHSPKLLHYWNLTIRLLSVISRTLVGRGGSYLLHREPVGIFYSPSRLSNIIMIIISFAIKPNHFIKVIIKRKIETGIYSDFKFQKSVRVFENIEIIKLLKYHLMRMVPLGIEPRASRVWSERDNRYTTEPVIISRYSVELNHTSESVL